MKPYSILCLCFLLGAGLTSVSCSGIQAQSRIDRVLVLRTADFGSAKDILGSTTAPQVVLHRGLSITTLERRYPREQGYQHAAFQPAYVQLRRHLQQQPADAEALRRIYQEMNSFEVERRQRQSTYRLDSPITLRNWLPLTRA